MLTITRAQSDKFKIIPVITLLLALTLVACQLDQPSVSTPAPDVPPLVSPTESPASQMLEVPIRATGASQLGSIEFVLVYEPSLLEVVEVKPGSLASNALIQFDSGTPGRLWTGIVDANGISGEGSLAVVSFRPVEMSQSPSPLVLENVSAYNVSTFLDMPAHSSSGELTIQGQQVTSPEVVFAQAQ